MSEQDKRWLLAVVLFIVFAAYTEIDSWVWRGQIRDLQRRIATLEMERR